MFVEVGSDSDNNYNLVHPRRKIIAVQEDFFFFNIGCKCAEQTVCSSEKIISWWGSRKRMILQTVDELQSQHSLLIVSDHQFWTAETGAATFLSLLSLLYTQQMHKGI